MIEQTLADFIGPVDRLSPVGGGSINAAYRAEMADGSVLFVKHHSRPPAGFFAAEAAGLEAIAATGTIRVPAVVLVRDHLLVLEWLEGAPGADYSARFGEQLAALHEHTRSTFGFDQDNYCGLTPQPNPAMEDGFAFFAEARLLHQGRLARNAGLLDRGEVRRLEQIAGQLDRWIPAQPASLIHGDLWTGNAHCGPDGEPVLVDPAAHYGWAEAELAMTTLFGALPASFYEAYEGNRPVARDWRERVPLYNLYHELNHLNLFGGMYYHAVTSTLRRYAT